MHNAFPDLYAVANLPLIGHQVKADGAAIQLLNLVRQCDLHLEAETFFDNA